MKCVNHQEAEAVALCSDCNEPICTDCRIALNGRDFCRQCLEERVKTVETFDSSFMAPKNKFLAFLLSFIPGAGYMYLGLMNRGLQTMVIFFGTIFISGMIRLESLMPLLLPIILFYNIFDTLQLANQVNDGVQVEDKPLVELGGKTNLHGLLGYALVGVGVLALINNIFPLIFHDFYLAQRVVVPLIIIALGVYILYRNVGRGGNNGGKGDV